MQDRKNSLYPVRLNHHAFLELPRVSIRLHGVKFYKEFIFTVTTVCRSHLSQLTQPEPPPRNSKYNLILTTDLTCCSNTVSIRHTITTWFKRHLTHTACERRETYIQGFGGGKPEGKRPLWRPKRRWKDNIKMILLEVGWNHGMVCVISDFHREAAENCALLITQRLLEIS